VAWLLAAIDAVLLHHPLFPHHLTVLIPPIVALALLAVAGPASYRPVLGNDKPPLAKLRPADPALCLTVLGVLLVTWASYFDFEHDFLTYGSVAATDAGAMVQQDLRAAADLEEATGADQWVITDGQFVAGLADRDVPPALVDTSTVRILSGYLSLSQLEQAAQNPRVHAILFDTGRFYGDSLAGFHAWVAQHFHLAHSYGSGRELWVR
jgi:hypothetical protein